MYNSRFKRVLYYLTLVILPCYHFSALYYIFSGIGNKFIDLIAPKLGRLADWYYRKSIDPKYRVQVKIYDSETNELVSHFTSGIYNLFCIVPLSKALNELNVLDEFKDFYYARHDEILTEEQNNGLKLFTFFDEDLCDAMTSVVDELFTNAMKCENVINTAKRSIKNFIYSGATVIIYPWIVMRVLIYFHVSDFMINNAIIITMSFCIASTILYAIDHSVFQRILTLYHKGTWLSPFQEEVISNKYKVEIQNDEVDTYFNQHERKYVRMYKSL